MSHFIAHLLLTSPRPTSLSFLDIIFFNPRHFLSSLPQRSCCWWQRICAQTSSLYSPVVVQPRSCTALMKTHVMPSCTNRHDNPAGTRQRRNERWGEGGRLIDSDREKGSKQQGRNQMIWGGGERVTKKNRGRLTTGEGKLRNKRCQDRGERRKSKNLRLKSEI